MAKIELDGMDQIFAKLETMGKQANKIENSALEKAGQYEAEEMEQEAPVAEKHSRGMSKSIEVSKVRTKRFKKYVNVAPDKDHFYYKFKELGTVKMPADPFMARTFERTKERLKEIIKEEFKKGLGL